MLCRAGEDRRFLAYALSTLGFCLQHEADTQGHTGDRARGAVLLDESLTLARAVGEPWLTAWVLVCHAYPTARHAAYTAAPVPDTEQASAAVAAEEALVLFEAEGDRVGHGWAQRTLGLLALAQQDYARARSLLSADLALMRTLGTPLDTAWVLLLLGDAALAQGDDRAALAYWEESLALSRRYELPEAVSVRARLGEFALRHGDEALARTYFAECLATAQGTDADPDQEKVRAVAGLAELAAAQGQPERAVRLAGAAAALRARSGLPAQSPRLWPLSSVVEKGAQLVAARHALGEPAATAAWDDGHAMTPEQAFTYALEQPAPG
jgi:tetratricopeptide (TPR) repeat protein